MNKEEKIAIETLKEVASDDYDTLGDEISPKMAQNIVNLTEKQQKEIENEKLYTDFYKDLCDKQQKELENNKKFKIDIVNLIMLWDKKELPDDNMVIECLDTIMNEVSRLEDIEDKKISVAVKFVEEKRDKYWKDKIKEKIKELEEVKTKELENDDEFGIHSLGWGNADYIQDYLKELLEENNND